MRCGSWGDFSLLDPVDILGGRGGWDTSDILADFLLVL